MPRLRAIYGAADAGPAAGFLQALTGLDIADSQRDSTVGVARTLFEGLLGSPSFDMYDSSSEGVTYPAGLLLYCASRHRRPEPR